jgi:NADH:ubiquinone oxidoreductase subunit E
MSVHTGDPRLDRESGASPDGVEQGLRRRRTTAPVPRFGHGSRVPGWDEAVDLAKDPARVPDPATTPVPDELRQAIEAAMAKYPDRRSAVIPALHAAQGYHGWCSPEAMEQVAVVMQVTPAYLTSVATFYDMFKTEPLGRHDVFVCTNISCSLRGAKDVHRAFLAAAERDPSLNVRSFECMGACDIAPMASIDDVYVGPLEPADAERARADLAAGRDVLADKQLARRPPADAAARAEASAAGPPMEGDAPGPGAPLHGESHPPETERRLGRH